MMSHKDLFSFCLLSSASEQEHSIFYKAFHSLFKLIHKAEVNSKKPFDILDVLRALKHDRVDKSHTRLLKRALGIQRGKEI